MEAPDSERLADLEQQVRDLKRRVAALERGRGGSAPDHPADQQVIQRKVVYDWQG